MNATKVRLLLLAGAALLLAACTATVVPVGDSSPLEQPAPAETPLEAPLETPAAAVQEETPTVSTPTEDVTEGATEGAAGGVSVSGIPSDLLNRILADAGERTGVAPDALVVTRAEAVTWNDGSLGCPEPGMFYTMALVDGYQIVVDAGGKTLDYRVQSSGLFRLCERTLRGGGNRP